MSQHIESDANAGRKRQGCDVALHTPTKRRNVLDSSPSPGPAQAEMFEDSEVNDFISTQLMESHEAQADDPQYDWRTEDSTELPTEESTELPTEEDDVVSDPDELPEVDSEPSIPQVIISAQDASQSRPTSGSADVKVHQRYSQFLHHLCEETGTDSVEAHVKDGLPFALQRARSINLDKDLSTNNELDIYGFALVIHVWNVVCLWVHYGRSPFKSLAFEFGVYFLSAHAVTGKCRTVTSQQLISAVQYWEKRLSDGHNRRSWRKWLRTVAGFDSTLSQSRNETANEYLTTLIDAGKAELAYSIMQKDASGPHNTPLRKYTQGIHSQKSWALSEIIGILVSMDDELLKGLIDGSLSRKAEIPAGRVSNALQRIRDQSPSPPSIYQNCICDRMGISPTPVQWETVCSCMSEYVRGGKESDELAMTVDQLIYPTDKWPPSLAKEGLRRYTEWRSYMKDNGNRKPSTPHRDMVGHFVKEMTTRIKDDLQSGRGHIPLAAPVIEIGFTINTGRRLREHRTHLHSNYLMNLAEAMFKHLYPSTFRLQQLVIYACWSPSQPWFSEIILTQLGQGYTDCAGGFSHYPAGRSNGSAYTKTSLSKWDRFGYEARRSGLLEREIKQIEDRIEREREESRRESERRNAAFEAELNYLNILGETLDALTDWVKAETTLASEQERRD